MTQGPVVDPVPAAAPGTHTPPPDARPDLSRLGGAITVMSSALLRWSHRHGGTAHCLARARLLDTGAHGDGAQQAPVMQAVVVLSELRDNPRGRGITADVPGALRAARAVLLPSAYPPDRVIWLVHHGQFSTYDPAGPDTLTRLAPHWDGQVHLDDVHDHELLGQDLTAALTRSLGLGPVEDVLRSWPQAGLPPSIIPPAAG